VLPVSDTYEARTAEGLDASLAAGRPAVLWLYQFPELTINHAVLAYRRLPGAEPRYLVVDPNYTDRPRTLRFDPRRRIFEYEPTFYFPGGPVTVRPVYLSAVQ